MSRNQILRTTVVGSFPSKPSGEDFMSAYKEFSDPFISTLEDAVNCQKDAGIDIIADGQTRSDMVGLFASSLQGIRMKSRPVIIGPIKYKGPITLDDIHRVRELAGDGCSIKGIITGAHTMANSCVDEHYGNIEALSYDFADALAKEASNLDEVVDMIQVDEPFFTVNYPEYGKELVEIIFKGVSVEKCLHVCGNVAPIFESLSEIKLDILDHEFAANPELLDVIREYDFEQMLGYGCVRSDINEAESVGTIAERIKRGIDIFGEDKLLLDPDCGLKQLNREIAIMKLNNMVKARDVVINEH